MCLSTSAGIGFQEPLIGGYDYASQSFVNLVLAGTASSQVFDGTKSIASRTIGGVPSRSEIGFLTRMEKMNPGVLEVGSNYKTPRLPIWVCVWTVFPCHPYQVD